MEGGKCFGTCVFSLFPKHGCTTANMLIMRESGERKKSDFCLLFFFFKVSILVEVWPISTSILVYVFPYINRSRRMTGFSLSDEIRLFLYKCSSLEEKIQM